MTKDRNKPKSFILRTDEMTMKAIEKWAADEFRSTNGQIQWILTEALRKAGRLRPRRKTIGEPIKRNAAGNKETEDDLSAKE